MEQITPPSQGRVSGCLQLKSAIAHLVLVKLSSVYKGSPGFLKETENSQKQDDKCVIGA